VLSTKVEIRLAKAEATNWTYFEYGKDMPHLKKNEPSVEVLIIEATNSKVLPLVSFTK